MVKKKKILIILCFIIGTIFIGLGIVFTTKFKNAVVELGNDVSINDFVRFGTTNNVKMDVSKVQKDVVGEYEVKIQYFFLNYNLKIKVEDTTPPELQVKNLYQPLDYQINVNDFIEKLEDKSEVDVKIENAPTIDDYGDYSINITAVDKYNNKITKTSTLSIGWVKKELSVEVGNEIKIEDLVYDIKNKDTINKEELDKINNEREGTYYLKSVLEDAEINIKIEKTKDVTPPTLELKTVSIYEGKKINSINDFVKKATDKGSKVTLKMINTIDYKKLGDQKISIEASDIDGNKTVKETKLKIVKDNIGPKISGLSKITVNKGTKINYTKGVSAYDDNFGSCTFEVNSNNVDTSKYGTYQAIYTSSDSLGNKTTSKRVIIVNHDQSDTNKKIKEIASSLSSNAEKIRDYVRNNIKYNTNWGGDDPVWYGLTNKVGNCFVHAKIFEALLKYKGYNTKLIWTTDKTHYWNMVYLNGKWVHMDSTPSSRHNKYSIMNDEQRYERLQGRNWDRSLWPKAE